MVPFPLRSIYAKWLTSYCYLKQPMNPDSMYHVNGIETVEPTMPSTHSSEIILMLQEILTNG